MPPEQPHSTRKSDDYYGRHKQAVLMHGAPCRHSHILEERVALWDRKRCLEEVPQCRASFGESFKGKQARERAEQTSCGDELTRRDQQRCTKANEQTQS